MGVSKLLFSDCEGEAPKVRVLPFEAKKLALLELLGLLFDVLGATGGFTEAKSLLRAEALDGYEFSRALVDCILGVICVCR